jgi:hypothetical protein
VLAASIYFFFPDSPLTAHFLTPKERAQAILRIKGNHSGIEQKRFKRYQYDLYPPIHNHSDMLIIKDSLRH